MISLGLNPIIINDNAMVVIFRHKHILMHTRRYLTRFHVR